MKVREIPSSDFSGGQGPLQTCFWAEVKKENSWKPYFFEVSDSKESFQLLVLTRSFLGGLVSLAYIPMGPPVRLALRKGAANSLAKELCGFLPSSVFALRMDFNFDYENSLGLAGLGQEETKAFFDKFCRDENLIALKESIQPQGTVFNDLTKPFSYRKRAVRILKKTKGLIQISEWDKDQKSFDIWYEIYQKTAQRDGFHPRSKSYLRKILDLDGSYGVKSKLLLARQEGAVKGGIITISFKQREVCLFAAALRDQKANASYALEDFALKSASEEGIKFYDFYGAGGPSGSGSNLASLDLFKLGFGGKKIFRIPTCDYVLKPVIWNLYRKIEEQRLNRARS